MIFTLAFLLENADNIPKHASYENANNWFSALFKSIHHHFKDRYIFLNCLTDVPNYDSSQEHE